MVFLSVGGWVNYDDQRLVGFDDQRLVGFDDQPADGDSQTLGEFR